MVLARVVNKIFLNIAERLAKRAESLRKTSVNRSTLKTCKKNNGLAMRKFAENSVGKYFPANPLKLVNIWPIWQK